MPTISELVNAEQTQTVEKNEVVETSATEVSNNGELVNTETQVNAENETKIEENNVSISIPDFNTTEEAEANNNINTEATQVGDWKEIIKKVDKKELAKAVRISDFALELNEYIANGGDATDYLMAKAIDWNKVSDTDLVLDELRKEYPDATSQQLQRLFSKKYNQTDLAEEEDKEDGELLMKADARKIRQSRIEQQSKFKMPESVQTQSALDLEKIKLESEKAEAEQFEKVKSYYDNHEATKNLMNSKRVAVQLGDKGSFNFNIDKPEAIMQMLLDRNTWQKVTSTAQGEPDVAKLQEIAIHAANPNYNMDLVNYGIALGKKMMVEEGQNAVRPIGTQPGSDGVSKGLVIKGTGTLKQHMGN